MTQIYTVKDRNDEVLADDLTAVQAMHEILRHDGHFFEMQHDGERWQMFYEPKHGAPMVPLGFYSTLESEAEAESEIADWVVREANDDWGASAWAK